MNQEWMPWNDSFSCIYLNSKGIIPKIGSTTLWNFDKDRAVAAMNKKISAEPPLFRSYTFNMKT